MLSLACVFLTALCSSGVHAAFADPELGGNVELGASLNLVEGQAVGRELQQVRSYTAAIRLPCVSNGVALSCAGMFRRVCGCVCVCVGGLARARF